MIDDRTEANRRVALRKATEGWGTEVGWRQVWDETCSPDFVSHFCGLAEPVQGLEAAKVFNAGLFEGFPNLEQTITAVAADGEHVAYRHRLTGRNEGRFLGRPATGRRVDITGMTWMVVRNGQVVEEWYELNHDELKRQLCCTAVTDVMNAGRDLYAALARGDADALKQLLAANFQGQLSPGLPHGLGRTYVGLESMMTEAWGAADELFEMSPHPEELIDAGDVLIGRGNYVGTARSSGKPLRAAFAHFWRFDGDRFTAVRQVTDSGKWRDALESDRL